MAVQFRCPHALWVVGVDKSRNEKPVLRRTLYDFPPGTDWTRVGHTFESDFVCPDCGDTRHFSTDQTPEEA